MECTGGSLQYSKSASGQETPIWEGVELPVLEMSADGSFLFSKLASANGSVNFGTVAKQLVHGMEEPGAFQYPDVTCDYSNVRIEEVREDVVRVVGCKGRPASDAYNVCCVVADDYKSSSLFLVIGESAGAKALQAHEVVLGRTRKVLETRGLEDFKESAGECMGRTNIVPALRTEVATEVVLKVRLKHRDPRALGIYETEAVTCGMALLSSDIAEAEGQAGSTRPKVPQAFRFMHLSVPKKRIKCEVAIADHRIAVPISTFGSLYFAKAGGCVSPVPAEAPTGELDRVRLSRLCWSRSSELDSAEGRVNIALVAQQAKYMPVLRHLVSAERVQKYFARWVKGQVDRHDMPGIHTMNFVCNKTLHSSSLGAALANSLLLMPVDIPKAWGIGDGTTPVKV